MTTEPNRIAVVTGGNKGIGLGIVKGLAKYPNFHVILTARDEARGLETLKKLHEEGLKNVEFVQLNVDDFANVEKVVKHIVDKHGRIDVLVNNAGIGIDFGVPFLEADFKVIEQTYHTNTLAPLKLCQLVVPLMKKNNYGRIVNLSSGLGGLTDMNGKQIGYRLSKVGLNCVTRVVNDETLGTNILVNSMCPGYVNTDMTKGKGTRTIEQGADTALWLSTLPSDGPRGGFFRDRKPLPW